MEVEWSIFPGPEYYDPGSVEDALRSIEKARSLVDDPGSAVRRAVGNDHSGTLYPAAVAATDRLLDIAEKKVGPPRQIALSVLLDWWGSFHPEPGYEVFEHPNYGTVDLISEIIRKVMEAKGLLKSISVEDPSSRKPAGLLLDCVEAGWTILDY